MKVYLSISLFALAVGFSTCRAAGDSEFGRADFGGELDAMSELMAYNDVSMSMSLSFSYSYDKKDSSDESDVSTTPTVPSSNNSMSPVAAPTAASTTNPTKSLTPTAAGTPSPTYGESLFPSSVEPTQNGGSNDTIFALLNTTGSDAGQGTGNPNASPRKGKMAPVRKAVIALLVILIVAFIVANVLALKRSIVSDYGSVTDSRQNSMLVANDDPHDYTDQERIYGV